MQKIKVFISSVQHEFVTERFLLSEYIGSDVLLGRFFEPFIFEKSPASDSSVQSVYLSEVQLCDVYIGIFGKEYGFQDVDGVSPTEREFDLANELHKTKLIYILDIENAKRHPKELLLIQKSEKIVVRKLFSAFSDLKASVYSSLVRYLEQKEYIRTLPFDASLNDRARIEDLDVEKIREFVTVAKAKRGFPLMSEASPEVVLTHLNLLNDNRVTGYMLNGELRFTNEEMLDDNCQLSMVYGHG